MKSFIVFLFYVCFILSCKKHPHQNVIQNLKEISISNEESAYPYTKNYKLIGFKDQLEYFFLINCYGSEIKGNFYIPKNKSYFDFIGKIDVTGSFIASVYNIDSHFVDTLKGYFMQDEIKCALAKNYENVLLGSIHNDKSIAIHLYSLKLSGKSENYIYEPKPKLLVHHTYLSTKDTLQKNFQSHLSKLFFHQILWNSDSIYQKMSEEILQYKDQFEEEMKKSKKVNSVDSLNRTWIKSIEVVYNQDSILSFFYLEQKEIGLSVTKIFQPFVFDFKKNRLLTLQDLPRNIQSNEIDSFLIYPQFIRIWKKDGTSENIPIK